MYHHILFDFDGTLYDTVEGIAKSAQYALEKLGVRAELDELRCFAGPPLVDKFMEAYGLSHEKAWEARGLFQERYIPVGVYESRPFPGMKEFLAALKEKGLTLAVATSKPLDLAEHLLNIRDNIVDLLVPFQSGWYYNRAMGGSFSIKSVLPAIFPDDPTLDYHNLESVHNGSEAMTIFPKIKDMPPEEQAKARHDLLKYCELDTYAMVKVWEELVRAANV